jgi:uncharacterized protein (TIGR02597 family)
MKKKFFYFSALLLLVSTSGLTQAVASSTAVASAPSGVRQITLLKGTANWFSLPLTGQPVFSGMVSAVTSNSISLGGGADTFATNLATPGSPYFVQFLSGAEAGRTMLITANTTTSLALDTTDNGIGSPVALTASGYSVAMGDMFQIIPGDTLASVFGAGTSGNPLLLAGGAYNGQGDLVMLCGPSLQQYYFNSALGYWVQRGSNANANNTIIYPFSSVCVLRVPTSNATLMLTGQMTPVSACTKVATNTDVYGSTHYAVGVTLAQLNLASTWLKSSNPNAADDIGVWTPSVNGFTYYYQQPNGNWYQCYGGNPSTVQNNLTLPAGAALEYLSRSAAVGAQAFVVSALPYTP